VSASQNLLEVGSFINTITHLITSADFWQIISTKKPNLSAKNKCNCFEWNNYCNVVIVEKIIIYVIMFGFQKEKDLELTARIGKELLSHNNKLEGHVAALETELKSANEKIEQISHELIKKTELIQVLSAFY